MFRNKQHHQAVQIMGQYGLWCVAGFDQSYVDKFLYSLVVPKFSLLRNLHTFNSGTKTDLGLSLIIPCVMVIFLSTRHAEPRYRPLRSKHLKDIKM